MTPVTPAPDVSPDERLSAALQEYQAALDLGLPVDRAAFAAGYPDLPDLADDLRALDDLHRVGEELTTGPPSPPAAEPTLADFDLVREAGRGGMGVVYEARQRSLGRRVAVKVLTRATALDDRTRRRFLHEARAAALVEHPHVVPVFHVGEEHGVPFYVMPFVPLVAPDFGVPTFARLSPGGTRLAVGNYERSLIYVMPFLPSGGIGVVTMAATSFDAEWVDGRRLLVTNQGGDGVGPPSVVSLVDVVSRASINVVENIDGASAGVTINAAGTIFTGDGFGADPTETGQIKAFRRAAWEAAVANRTPIDFETAGAEVANLLSCYPLGFDGEGNLYVGGGNGGDGDEGYAAVVSRVGVRAALNGGPPVRPDTPGLLQKLDPDPANPANFWYVTANPVRREVYLLDYGQAAVRVYRQHTLASLVAANVHVGDTAAAFPAYRFVGMEYRTPVPIPSPAGFTGPLVLRLETEEVQTLGGARHAVSLNGVEVGRVTDGGFEDVDEAFEFLIPRAQVDAIVAIANPAELSVRVDGSVGTGMADDFVVRRVGTIVVPA